MKNNNLIVGKVGERLACEYFVKNGWTILIKNYRQKFDEIDIVAKTPEGVLVFCEVKTILRKNFIATGGLLPEDNLTSAKLRKLYRSCRMFAGKRPGLVDPAKGWRIDLLAIDLGPNGKASDIRHYENI